MPTLLSRSRPNLRGRLILRRLFDAAQQPTVSHSNRWRVDTAHAGADRSQMSAIEAEQLAKSQPDA